MFARVLKGEARDARRSLLRDHLDAFHHARNHLVLQAHILALGILAHDHQVHAGIFRGEAGQIANGPQIGEKIELLAQRDVDALEAAADRRRHRPLERHAVAFDGFVKRRGNVLAVNLEGLGARGKARPLKLRARRLQNAHHRLRNFRPNPVAGNQRNFVSLLFGHSF